MYTNIECFEEHGFKYYWPMVTSKATLWLWGIWFLRLPKAYDLAMTRIKSSQYLFCRPILKSLVMYLVKSTVSQINNVAKVL